MSDNSTKEKKLAPAPTLEMAVVQCDGYRCLAFRDGKKWRDFQTGEEIKSVQDVVHVFPL